MNVCPISTMKHQRSMLWRHCMLFPYALLINAHCGQVLCRWYMMVQNPGPSSVKFLPMIILDPGNLNCIYSTLEFISEPAARYQVTPIVTFDQPLWWKALHIILSLSSDSPLRGIILRFVGFHTLMSYLGSMGYIMEDTGIHPAFQLVYAQSTVNHMLSGKAYASCTRPLTAFICFTLAFYVTCSRHYTPSK